jgi:hypothetical protein
MSTLPLEPVATVTELAPVNPSTTFDDDASGRATSCTGAERLFGCAAATAAVHDAGGCDRHEEAVAGAGSLT